MTTASPTPAFRLGPLDVAAIERLVEPVRAAGRRELTEPEALTVVAALGIGVPLYREATVQEIVAGLDLAPFPGERVVLKAVYPGLLHKSEVGGVAVVDKDPATLAQAARRMVGSVGEHPELSFLIEELVAHESGLGGELLVGVRRTAAFGPVVVFGPGGVWTEHLAACLRPERGTAFLAPGLTPPERLGELVAEKAVTPVVTGRLRGRPPLLPGVELLALLERLLAFAEVMPAAVEELEINPLAPTPDAPVALDAVVRLTGEPPAAAPPPRPLTKLRRLLEPRSIAVVGVSRDRNPGRILLENTLAAGFPPERITVVKPGADEIAGCRAVPGVTALPEPVDLAVLAVAAERIPEMVEALVAGERAESLILIPGGLGERAGTGELVEPIQRVLAASRERPGGGTVANGGNCLGVRSVPGRLDTLFIPRHKLAFPGTPPAPLAIVSQSGAFAVARTSRMATLNPRYVVSLGNQIDLTAGDYLAYLAEEPAVEVVACYLEGFRPGDGRLFVEAARRLTGSGRTVLLYRAGRTAAGARAAASHTASLASEEAVARELARAAGVVVVDRLADFEALTELFVRLGPRRPAGWRLGAVSNAGFECVAAADHLGPFRLAPFGEATRERLGGLLAAHHLDTVVEVGNPLDLTPILDDQAFVEASRTLLAEPAVDLGVVGCVPLTGALATLAPGPDHGEDAAEKEAVGPRLVELFGGTEKPWGVVVDGGPAYEPLRELLRDGGVPVFGSMDRAVELLGAWAARWLGGESGASRERA